MQGETYNGKAFVVNDWSLTTYAPIRNVANTIVGAIYVGQRMLNSQVNEILANTIISGGYSFICAETGEFLIHPTLDSSSNLYDMVPAFKNVSEGFVRYTWKGDEKVTNVKEMKGWGVEVAIGTNRVDMVGGLDEKTLLVILNSQRFLDPPGSNNA